MVDATVKNLGYMTFIIILLIVAILCFFIWLVFYIPYRIIKFFVKLILENKTTIETLDHKGKEFKSKFDKGKWDNYYEVMGMSKVLWFFPLKRYYGKPKGNGIEWGELIEDASLSCR